MGFPVTVAAVAKINIFFEKNNIIVIKHYLRKVELATDSVAFSTGLVAFSSGLLAFTVGSVVSEGTFTVAFSAETKIAYFDMIAGSANDEYSILFLRYEHYLKLSKPYHRSLKILLQCRFITA